MAGLRYWEKSYEPITVELIITEYCMYTECPDCQTFFKITPDQLKAAEGKVRCGNCNFVFNALTNLVDKIPPANAEGTEDAEATETNGDVTHAPSSVLEYDEAPESVIAFQVSDPESELALTQFSLPSTSVDGQQLSENSTFDKKDELSLESVDADKTAQSPSSIVQNSDLDLSVLASQVDELPKESEVSSVKTELSGFSELKSMVAELEREVSIAENKNEQSSDELQLPKVEDDNIDDANQTIHSDSFSFSDIEVPGVESGFIASNTNLSDINNEINEALDDLFDEGSKIEKPTSASSSAVNETPESEMNFLSNLDELDEDASKEKVSREKASKEKASKEKASLKIQSEVSEFNLDDDKEFTPKVKIGKKSEAVAKEPNFDLDDSFLPNDRLDTDAVDWEPYDQSSSIADRYDKENDKFKLEELTSEKPTSSGNTSRILWVIVISVLLVTLIGQFVYFKRAELAKYPSIRPILEQACSLINAVVDCKVPDPRDVDAIVIIERNVVSHPNAKNALLITSIIKNDAVFDQQFPELVLTFSDINQKVLARRTFKPEEYLAKSVDIAAGMKSKLPVKILLEIVDPGEEAVNFNFDFR